MKVRLAIALVVCLVGTASAALQGVRGPSTIGYDGQSAANNGIERRENADALIALQMRPQ